MDVSLKPIHLASVPENRSVLPLKADGKISILLVDDQPANLFALESLLDNPEYSLVKAFSGTEALRCLLQHDFAIVLLDVLMPGMDGFETADLIRQRHQSKHTPIIFITAGSSNETHISRGYSLGAVDYIYKPIVPEILKTKVQVFVDLYKKSAKLLRSEEALRIELAEHKRLEEARRDSEGKYRELFSRASDAIVVFDSVGKVIDANRAALKLYGFNRTDIRKISFQDISTDKEILVSDEYETDSQRAWRYQKRRDGSVFPAEITHGTFTVNGNKISMILTRDITERLAAEESRRLKERESLQRELVATVSHELRTPIAAIKASAETLQRGGIADAKSMPRFLKIIEGQANRLGNLVEDLLTVAEFESGKAKPEPKAIFLRAFVQQFVKDIAPLAAHRKISLQVNIKEEVQVWIDQNHFSRILQNLVDNAIKYNRERGLVGILARRVDDKHAQITIQDNGIGIPAKDIPLIFHQFHRTERAREHASRGTGLGLYIIKTVIESNGGKIWAESKQNKGSKFHFTVPLCRPVASVPLSARKSKSISLV